MPMSFLGFLKNVAKIGLGYVGGFILLFAGLMSFSFANNTVLSVLLVVAGVVLALFGVYTEREM